MSASLLCVEYEEDDRPWNPDEPEHLGYAVLRIGEFEVARVEITEWFSTSGQNRRLAEQTAADEAAAHWLSYALSAAVRSDTGEH